MHIEPYAFVVSYICNPNMEENKGKNELQKYNTDNQKHMT